MNHRFTGRRGPCARHPPHPGCGPARLASPSPRSPPTTRTSPRSSPPWLRAHTEAVDLVHIHFGFEHCSPERIREFVDECAATATRLVVTVHDLDNPHLTEQADHHERLTDLIRAAEAVITLTPAAAARIEARLGIAAEVIPHPFIVEPAHAHRITAAAAGRRTGRRVGLFLKSMRHNTATDPEFHRTLAAGLTAAEAELHVHVHEDAADHPLVTALAATWGDGLHVHPRMDDAALFAAVAEYDAVVLPYIRGSHSGWLEMCRDLSVTVVAPDCGYYADQADRPGGVVSYATGAGASAAEAALTALAGGPLPYGGNREREYAEIVRAHHRIYTGRPAAEVPAGAARSEPADSAATPAPAPTAAPGSPAPGTAAAAAARVPAPRTVVP
ncbi:glycosyltransferase [Brevibacterium ihuae]|uniref:glycosyltransferase n=1 Tax=Brevibacterium ihuae TaxID=1631743 RepID=UPI0015E0CA34|nr:glycosyltransferase [Brevibacterium ihuae]